jgi:hypothetical protein
MFGVLEHILSFVPVPDLVTASYVSKRWKEAARSDFLWKPLCRSLWKGKWSMPHVNDEEDNEVRRFDQGSVFLWTAMWPRPLCAPFMQEYKHRLTQPIISLPSLII